ncbi:MAG: enolase C-terminal domain-like protein [Nitrososphaerota archaeon]
MKSSRVISSAVARIVFDSRGSETIEVELASDGVSSRVSAPGGKSRGGREVQAYPPNGPLGALQSFNELVKRRLIGMDPRDQKGVDMMLKDVDGTPSFSVIGGNTAYSISICAASLAAKLEGLELWRYISRLSGLGASIPLPLGNVLGGGTHAGRGAPDIQEMLVFPTAAANPFEAIRTNITVHRRLGEKLSEVVEGYGGGRGDEGAHAPPLDNEAALKTVSDSSSGLKVSLGVDMAASTLYDSVSHGYMYRRSGVSRDRAGQMDFIEGIVDRFGLRYVEDPMEESDWDGFRELRRRLPKVLICGDDLVVTRPDLVREAARIGAVNAVILKPNQVGTLTTTLEAAREADRLNVVKVFSHRSGETCDPVLSHIAVGAGANLIKSGVVGGERVAKANELLRIWERSDGILKMSRVDIP